MNITITESARVQIKKLLLENNKGAFRVAIQAGGCSGFIVKFEYDEKKEKDHCFNEEDGLVVIDQRSMLFLKGATLNYDSDLNNTGFKIENITDQKRSCGCGQSFGT